MVMSPVGQGKNLAADPYGALVRYYDAETQDKEDDLQAYTALVKRFGGPVLDVGCGTGRVAFALVRQKIAITAIDISEPMLSRARARSEQEAIDSRMIQWQQEDITLLSLKERFGLAVFAYNGFMHLLDQDMQLAALKRIAQHLKPGGGIIIDIANPIEMFRAEDSSGIFLERIFTDPDTGDAVVQQSSVTIDRSSQIMEVTWIYDRIDYESIVHRSIVPLTLRYVMPSEITLMMKIAGFDQVELCGDYDLTPYEEGSSRLFIIGVKINT
jgi:SAM-dependent methyltransferase